ncbi:MAG: hypothetical protein GTO17_09545 [Candidatus Aminicenantes bacterium]|nr:hypothetical protein [Candidatus Aminicenantes bacterium]
MLKTSSFKKGIAVLVSVAVLVLLFPGVTHTSTDSNNPKFPLLKKFLSSFSSVFPYLSFDVFVMGTSKDKTSDDQNGKKKKDPFDDGDNSTSKRKPNGKD